MPMNKPNQGNVYFSIIVAAVVGAISAFLILSAGGLSRGDAVSVPSVGGVIQVDPDQIKDGLAELRDEEAATIGVVQALSPAVVSVGIFKERRTISNQTGPFFFDEFFFGEPFGLSPDGSAEAIPREKVQVGGGTGFVIAADGMILTNRHVVEDEDAEYRVTLANDREFVAQVLARDPIHDIAVIQIEANDLPFAQLGDSDGITIGQTVIAIGNALSEFDNTVTRGIISGINRRVVAGNGRGSNEVIEEAIQTDAAINPGNSGGPLISLDGVVIGVNTAVSRQGQSVGFATPINVAKRAIDSVQKFGRIVRPWLGVRYSLLDQITANALGLSVHEGAYIVPAEGPNTPGVIPGSPAALAGVQEGDVIVRINDKLITQDNPLAKVIAEFAPEDQVTLGILRDAQELDLSVILGEFGQTQ